MGSFKHVNKLSSSIKHKGFITFSSSSLLLTEERVMSIFDSRLSSVEV
jgi:hypothetical protein